MQLAQLHQGSSVAALASGIFHETLTMSDLL